jgi:hypothetical protein
MWHFGADALVEYSGEKFAASWETAENEMICVYSKEFPGRRNGHGSRTANRNKTRVRVEVKECPQLTVENAIKDIVKGCDFAI